MCSVFLLPAFRLVIRKRVVGLRLLMGMRPVLVSINTCVVVNITLCPELTNVPSDNRDFCSIRKTWETSDSGSNVTGRW